MTIYQYGLAAGHNGTPTNIEDITPTGDFRAFVPPLALPNFDPGMFRIRGNGTGYESGYPLHNWVFGAITRLQLQYLRTTYCGGGWTGLVTVRTRTAEEIYRDYNATMWLTKPIEAQYQFTGYPDYLVKFTRLVEVGAGFDIGFDLGFDA